MKNFYSKTISTAFALVFGFCSLFAQYNSGIIFTNEGNFGSPNASISYVNMPGYQQTDNVYQTVNGEPIGDVLQSMAFNGDYAYLVVNNSNKIIKVNRATFEKQTVITEQIDQPRYMAFASNKYYVTNARSKNITVYNAETDEYLKTIEVGHAMEKIVSYGKWVGVMQSYFGSGNTLLLVDSESDEIVYQKETEEAIKDLDMNKNEIAVLTNNKIVVFNLDNLQQNEIAINGLEVGDKIAFDGDDIYFKANTSEIYKVNKDATQVENTPFVTVEDNGTQSWSILYGFGVIDGAMFAADAMDFVAPSRVSVYYSGNLMATITTGIGTNGVYDNRYTMASVENPANQLALSVYPNPADNQLFIKGIDKAQVNIYALNGALVKQAEYNGKALNVSDLSQGMYILKVTADQGTYSTKLMIK